MIASALPAFPLSVLKPMAARALEMALDRLLALDEDTRQRLSHLDGRTLAFTLESPPLAVQLQVEGNRLRVGPVESSEPDLAIRSTLSGVLAGVRGVLRANAGQESTSAPVGQVRVAGDVQLARELQQLVTRFDPDWQRPFVTVFGEVMGVQIAVALTTALDGLGRTGRALAGSTGDWLTEESRLVVSGAELDAFADDVTALDTAASRLEARVSYLANGGRK